MKKIILALDTANLEDALNIYKKIKDKIFTIKIGLELWNSFGKEGIKKFNEIGVTNLMLDLKLKDIPETVYKSIKTLNDIQFGFLTIHGQGGKSMIDKAKKAAELFETVVTARLANEMENIQKELEEQSNIERETFKEEMVGKIDQYLNYVAENWMKENELAIERGLRTEITEDFIKSLKQVFAEHYIEVPQDKYDVLGEMQDEIESLKKKLNESVEAQISITGEREALLRSKVIGEAAEDLTLTEQEKLTQLLEDVDFGSTEMFAEKVSVVKENYFPKQEQTLTEESDKMTDTVDEAFLEEGGTINKYAQAISRQLKK